MADSFASASVARQLDNCSFCPKMCRHACPVSNADGREAHIPQAKMDLLNELRQERIEWSAEASEPLWACTGCRQCTTFCDHRNEPGLVLFGGRAEANARGAGHPKLARYPERFMRRERRLAALARDQFASDSLSRAGSIGFWPGCDALDKGLGDVRAALELFESLAVGPVQTIAADRVCGGYPLLAAGYPDLFRAHAREVAADLDGYHTVITNCSACLFAMRSQYPAEGVELSASIVSLPEFLAAQVAKIPEPPPGARKSVYYHDPCYLARYSAVLDEPRRALARVADVREFRWSGTETECCGGAGLLPKTMPATADAMARQRLREVSQQGGGTVVTACATCAFMLKSNAPNGVEVSELSTFLRRETEGSSPS